MIQHPKHYQCPKDETIKILRRKKLEEMIHTTLNENDDGMSYGDKLFKCFVSEWIEPINVNIPSLNDEMKYLFIKDLFLNNDNYIFYFDKFFKLFSNISTIVISGNIGNDGLFLDTDNYHKLFNDMIMDKILKSNDFGHLHAICLFEPQFSKDLDNKIDKEFVPG